MTSDKLPNTYYLSLLTLERQSSISLYWQIYEGLRNAILSQQLKPGIRLPSTRDLAEVLGVSRNTVVYAYDQLTAEGYLDAMQGSGTYIREWLPDGFSYRPHSESISEAGNGDRSLSKVGQTYRQVADQMPWIVGKTADRPNAFPLGQPALDAFPRKQWGALMSKHSRDIALESYNRDLSPMGYQPLRAIIADYLRSSRGVHCEMDQVLITAGSQQGLQLISQVLVNPGNQVWIENPGYPGVPGAMLSQQPEFVAVPVDDKGLIVEKGVEKSPQAQLAVVTPTHQFPLGVTMSLERRLALLAWARQAESWIVEDDYDSPYRYTGHPLASLQGLDVDQRVIYVGTFSKVMYPGIRLGYLILPPDLVSAFVAARFLTDRHSPYIVQRAMTDFINEGYFIRHIRRMRHLYARRRDALCKAIQDLLRDKVSIGAVDTGMHMVMRLPDKSDEVAIVDKLYQRGIETAPLSQYIYAPTDCPSGLVLGFASANVNTIQQSVGLIGEVLDEMGVS